MPMTDEEIAHIKMKPLHFPTVLGAVVITYNIPGVKGALKLSAGGYRWDLSGSDYEVERCKDQGGQRFVNLPDKAIVVTRRSDASGTSFVFTDYLSQVSPEWKSKVGANSMVSWPTGLGQKGNDGVAGWVKQTPYSIGYVELLLCCQNKMTFADVKNAAGQFVTAEFRGRDCRSRRLKRAGQRISRLDRKRSRCEILSDLHLHLVADPQPDCRCELRKKPLRSSSCGC